MGTNTRTNIRYNKRSLDTIILQLTAWVDQTRDSMDNTENEERLDMLDERITALEEAIDALSNID